MKVVHNVYFTLKDDSDQAVQALLDSCEKYLTGHPGVEYYAAGRLADDLQRPVNVRDFQVGLHVVFGSREAHDTYQTSDRHVQFIETNKETWAQVRVFDTYIQ